jgi:signal transduction histidine kinase
MHTAQSLLDDRDTPADTEARLRAALHALEHVEREQRFLAEAGEALGSSLDYRETLNTVAHLAAGTISDFCIVAMLDDAGRFIPIASEDTDGEQCKELCAAMDASLPQDGAPVVLEAMGTNMVIVLPSIPADDHHPFYHALHAVGTASVIVAPMVARDRAIGVILLASRAQHRPYTEADSLLARELSRRAALAVDNARLYEQAQRALRARDEMLSVVAHDLRNPLNVISMSADLLDDLVQDMPDPLRAGIERIRRSGTQMNRLIQDLLDVSKIDGNGLRLELTAADPSDILKEAAYMLRPLVEQRSITFSAQAAESLPRINADRARLLQALGNLVSNAIKFTAPGGTVSIVADQAECDVRFTVRDTGKGIAPIDLPHVFDRFWQERPADARGVGLGLAIVQGIVASHGGKVTVESELGIGTTFTVIIPTQR